MSKQITKTIDDLGRINLPVALRQKLNWGIGDEIELCHENETLVLKLSKRHEGINCAVCNKPTRKLVISGSNLCSDCTEDEV